jgi:hypothetical protein
MSEQSPETPRDEERASLKRSDEASGPEGPDVEGHFAAWEPSERALRSGEAGEPEGPDVEGHMNVFEPSEGFVQRSGETGEPDVEGHMAPLGTEERPVRMSRPKDSGEPEGPDVEGHMFRYRAAEPARKKG